MTFDSVTVGMSQGKHKDKYAKPLKHYAIQYGVAYRTVLRWAEKGIPLDDEQATRLATGTPATGSQIGQTPDARRIARNRPRTDRKEGPAPHGMPGNTEALRAAAAEAHGDYLTAIDSGDDVLASARLKAWLSISEQLRKAEQSTLDVEEQKKNTVSIGELGSVLGDLFKTLRQDLEALPETVSLELVGKDSIGIKLVLQREVERLVTELFKCSYLEGGKHE